MKILVTGRDGQLARSLIEAGAAAGVVELVALGRPELDLERPETIRAAIRRTAPDLVVNAAAYTAVDLAEDEAERAFQVNAAGAGEVAAAAAEAGAPVIQISTDYVFDGRREGAYREDDPTNPLGVYGRSKRDGEEAVRKANPDHLILRTSWVYSRYGRNFVKTMMAIAERQDVVTVVDDQMGCPTSAHDLAEAILRLAATWRHSPRLGLGETFHLAGSGRTSWFEFARHVFAECRSAGLPAAEVQPIRTADRPSKAVRPMNSVLDCSKFRTAFGFELPDWHGSAAAVVQALSRRAD